MRDKASLSRVELLHPKIREEVKNRIDKIELGFPSNMAVRIVQGLRTFAEQNALYAQGRTRPGKIVTNAKAGSSFHNYGLAIDFAILHDKNHDGNFEELSWNVGEDFDNDRIKDWMEVVRNFKVNGYEWGGDWHSFKDLPHLQKTFGYTWQTLLKLHDAKRIDKQGYVII